MKIHASGEDYLEAVLVLQKNHGAWSALLMLHGVLAFQKPSVSSCGVGVLREGGFLTVDE